MARNAHFWRGAITRTVHIHAELSRSHVAQRGLPASIFPEYHPCLHAVGQYGTSSDVHSVNYAAHGVASRQHTIFSQPTMWRKFSHQGLRIQAEAFGGSLVGDSLVPYLSFLYLWYVEEYDCFRGCHVTVRSNHKTQICTASFVRSTIYSVG